MLASRHSQILKKYFSRPFSPKASSRQSPSTATALVSPLSFTYTPPDYTPASRSAFSPLRLPDLSASPDTVNLPEALLFAVRYLGSYRAYFYFALFTAILIIQLFLPPSVGNADNADSVRLIGGAGLVPNYPPQDRYFNYFTPDYVRTKPNPARRGPLWFTGSVTFHISELLGLLKSGDHFDIRWLGFVHMIVFLIDFGLLLFVLRAVPALIQWCVPALSIWIFGDVVYVAYLNSLYLDAMGLLCFLALVLASVALFTPGSNLGAAVLSRAPQSHLPPPSR